MWTWQGIMDLGNTMECLYKWSMSGKTLPVSKCQTICGNDESRYSEVVRHATDMGWIEVSTRSIMLTETGTTYYADLAAADAKAGY